MRSKFTKVLTILCLLLSFNALSNYNIKDSESMEYSTNFRNDELPKTRDIVGHV